MPPEGPRELALLGAIMSLPSSVTLHTGLDSSMNTFLRPIAQSPSAIESCRELSSFS